MSRTKAALALCAGLSLTAVLGCAHKNDPPAQSQTQTQSKSSTAPAPQAAATPAAKPIPKGHPFGKIQEGMSDADVKKVLGEPTGQHAYVTGKAFIPYYYGSDTSRTEWTYKGKGSVVFSRNRWNGSLSVVEVLYDPATP